MGIQQRDTICEAEWDFIRHQICWHSAFGLASRWESNIFYCLQMSSPTLSCHNSLNGPSHTGKSLFICFCWGRHISFSLGFFFLLDVQWGLCSGDSAAFGHLEQSIFPMTEWAWRIKPKRWKKTPTTLSSRTLPHLKLWSYCVCRYMKSPNPSPPWFLQCQPC